MNRFTHVVAALIGSLACAWASPGAAAVGEPAPHPSAAASSTLALPAVPPRATHGRFGVAVNPFMPVIGIATAIDDDPDTGDRLYLTGTLSAAVFDGRTELAVPFAVIDEDSPDDVPHESDFSLRRVDLQLRRYQKDGRRGAYFGPLLRFSHIEGYRARPTFFFLGDSDAPLEPLAFSRRGVGVVLGVRARLDFGGSIRPLFWGANVHVGKWLNDSPGTLGYLVGPLEDASSSFYNIEFAKIGMRF